jgi:hypothetical protein
LAEGIQNRFVARRAPGNGAMREGVCIDAVSAEVFEHFPHNAFAGGDVSGQAYDVFCGPLIAHKALLKGD